MPPLGVERIPDLADVGFFVDERGERLAIRARADAEAAAVTVEHAAQFREQVRIALGQIVVGVGFVVEPDFEVRVAVEPGGRIAQLFREMIDAPQHQPAMIVGEQV
jgi:hypothetical protein